MAITHGGVSDLATLLELDPLKPDAWLGTGPDLGWGRIYGGQIVAQALRAATLTVPDGRRVHSLHAYFIRPGHERQAVLFEVERLRDGRSFSTRQVVAYQSAGAILNLIASFHDDEPDAADTRSWPMPLEVATPDTLPSEPTDLLMDHRIVRRSTPGGEGALVWLRALGELGDDPAVHACALAYLSDEDPLGVAVADHPLAGEWEAMMAASLDHAVWFHRPVRADDWLLFSLTGHGMANARGLAVARVHTTDGTHVATIAQEGLGRELRRPVASQ
jgi:acyl-CoA thioesterase-2